MARQQRESDAYQITWLVRRLFRALSQKAGEQLDELGVSVADRAVMEFLYPEQRLSVPEIAERYQVSRQHIQVTVNTLLDGGLVATRDNPRHKRSPLIVLSRKGRALFEKIRRQEQTVINEMFSDIPGSDRRRTRQVLEKLLSKLT
jgi:DNA-binding MarR family transcriptional regulator